MIGTPSVVSADGSCKCSTEDPSNSEKATGVTSRELPSATGSSRRPARRWSSGWVAGDRDWRSGSPGGWAFPLRRNRRRRQTRLGPKARRPDQPLQLDGAVGQEIVHSRREQQQIRWAFSAPGALGYKGRSEFSCSAMITPHSLSAMGGSAPRPKCRDDHAGVGSCQSTGCACGSKPPQRAFAFR